jgi:hypothetical protein
MANMSTGSTYTPNHQDGGIEGVKSLPKQNKYCSDLAAIGTCITTFMGKFYTNTSVLGKNITDL